LELLFQRHVKAVKIIFKSKLHLLKRKNNYRFILFVQEIARKAEQLAMAHDYVEEPEMSRV